jgi:outer membrane protein OmpA-like peptidoglycan-associated protein
VDLSTALGVVELEKPIELVTLEEMRNKDIALSLNNLFFETGSYEIKQESFPELERLAELIKSERLKIQILGHTDNIGAETTNLKLSENRANAVRDYLISRGCKESELDAHGYGETRPISSNDSPEGRATNRRVEIKIQ